jgi:hypothetical protein
MKGQKYAAVASAAIIMVLEPLLTVIAAALWYGEQLPLQKIIGGVLILVAQLWFRWRMLKPYAKPVRRCAIRCSSGTSDSPSGISPRAISWFISSKVNQPVSITSS